MQLLRRLEQLTGRLTRFARGRVVPPKQFKRERTETDPASTELALLWESLKGASLTKAEALMLEEYQQVWDHTRHLETMRSQYLGFFFTVALGLGVLAVPAISAGALSDPPRLVMLSGFLTIFFLFTAFIYIALRKTGVVYTQYVRAIHLIRDYFLADSRGLEAIISQVRFLESDVPIMHSRLFRIQATAELIIRVFMLLTVVTAGFLALRLTIIGATVWQVGLATIIVCIILAGSVLLIFSSKGKRRRP